MSSAARSRWVWTVAAIACLSVVLMLTAAYLGGLLTPLDAARQLDLARDATRRRAFDEARGALAPLLKLADPPRTALLLAVRNELAADRLDDALLAFDRLPIDDRSDVVELAQLLFSTGFSRGRLADGIDRLSARCAAKPSLARGPLGQLLGQFLSLGGQYRAGRRCLIESRRAVPTDVRLLLWLARPESIHSPESKAILDRGSLDDPYVRSGLARWFANQSQFEPAQEHARAAVALRPSLIEMHALLGRLQRESQDAYDADAADAWERSLPAAADGSPDVWLERSHSAAATGDVAGALRAALESARLDDQPSVSIYRAAQALRQQGELELADAFLGASQRVDAARAALRNVLDTPTRADYLVQLAAAFDLAGWSTDALLWSEYLAVALPRDPANIARIVRLETEVASSSPSLVTQLVARAQPNRFRWKRFEITTKNAPSTTTVGVANPSTTTADVPFPDGRIRFEEEAERRGLRFTYDNGHDASRVAMLMHEFTGGGVACHDFDRDGWVDAAFTQGGHRAPSRRGVDESDEIFRNRSGERFAACGASMFLTDDGYGQGLAWGDLDEDGFPDLYVANAGVDRCWRNLGDGTFIEWPLAPANGPVDGWSTSVAIADLNGDHLPDLYVTQYVAGDDVFTKLCRDERGVERSCQPPVFPAAPDRVLINRGDGQFIEQSEPLGLSAPNGRGLGVVAYSPAPGEPLHVFVANDGEANFLFTPEAADSTNRSIRYVEQATLRGAAFDGMGKPQACMGIAVGDVNGDARTDIFVTNYYLEPNTLYRQTASGDFTDATREAGLHTPSLLQLGFGTQFLDVDGDGDDDVIIVNGHEGDYRDRGIPFQMPPQCYENVGLATGRFRELPAQTLGRWFHEKTVGRALARCDWNGDGRPDFVATHLDRSVSLATNRSTTPQSWIELHLVGVVDCRTPTGAWATVSAGSRRVQKTLTSGDGYFATNAPGLQFSLPGDVRAFDAVTVQWPNGDTQTWTSLEAHRRHILRQGDARHHTLP